MTVTMNDPIERELLTLTEREKPFRDAIANADEAPAKRLEALEVLSEAQLYIRGFLSGIRLTKGEQKAKYYEEFVAQARSDKGLIPKEEQ